MKSYTERKTVDLPAQVAWEALTHMDAWLPSLSTNAGVTWDEASAPFFVEGRQYDVHTKESVTMRSRLHDIDEDGRTLQISAHWFVLESRLTCQVVATGDDSCELVRTQAYPGPVGWLFTHLFDRRESGETSEYLDVWAAYAERGQATGEDAR